MNRKLQRRISAVITMVLLLTTLIPALAFAETASIKINMYSAQPGTNGKPADDTKIPRYTSDRIDITANITGISDDQVPNIYYEIYNPDTKQLEKNTLNKATRTGSLIKFTGVPLFPGLNMITLKMGTSNGINSEPAWAYFTPVTGIGDLKINGVAFEDKKIYPENPVRNSSNPVSITGHITNATEISATLNTQTNPSTKPTMNGDFTFTGDDIIFQGGTRMWDFYLRPGDNKIVFTASNNLNTTTLSRQFVYDNGQPFAFNATLTDGSGSSLLLFEPVTPDPVVTLDADVKVDCDPNVNVSVYGCVLEHPTVTLNINGATLDGSSSSSQTYSFSSAQPASAMTASARGIFETNRDKTGKYRVFHIRSTVNLVDTDKQARSVAFTFGSSTTSLPYGFFYANPNQPSVEMVRAVTPDLPTPSTQNPVDTLGAQLSSLGENNITELPQTLRIFSNKKTNKLEITDAETTVIVSQIVYTTTDYNVFEYPLDQYKNGVHTLEIVPYLDAAANLAGKKAYTLNVDSTPYIIMSNLFNGQIISNEAQSFGCTSGSTSGKCFEGKVINVPPADYNSIGVTVNGGTVKKLTAGDFTGNRFKFFYETQGFQLQEGKNTVTFYLYRNGVLVTKTSYEIFKFANPAPTFGSISPVATRPSDKPLFIKNAGSETYSTSESKVIFTGTMWKASILTLTAKSSDVNGNPVTKSSTLTFNGANTGTVNSIGDSMFGTGHFLKTNLTTVGGDPDNKEFTTEEITLNPNGDTTFEFEITNPSNMKVFRTITIRREPVPYKVHWPENIVNAKGEIQANINSNFQRIELEAEFADKVFFGKNEAVKDPTLGANMFVYEAKGLKPGKNSVKFTVYRGTNATNGVLVLNNMNTPIEGASFKAPLASNMKIFEGKILLKFPKNTYLMRNYVSGAKQYLTADRNLFFGIAHPTEGRVNKANVPLPYPLATIELKEKTGRFEPASPLFWMDAGSIREGEDLEPALTDDGDEPYIFNNRNGIFRDNFFLRNKTDDVVPTQRGTLTLQYDPNIREDAWRYITVYHYSFHDSYNGISEHSWKNIGGVVDAKKNTITVPFDSFGYYRVMYMTRSFDDVIFHPWAKNEMDTLYSKGIMTDKSGTLFQPNDPITRGEFISLLVKIFDIPLNYQGSMTFNDVNPSLSDKLNDYRYIETAARAGIVRGMTQSIFSPKSTLAREDAAVMIAKAAELKLNSDPDKSLAALQKLFSDANGVNYYARTSVEAVVKAKLMNGKPNYLIPGTTGFDPRNSITRAEAASIAMKVLQQQKKVPK